MTPVINPEEIIKAFEGSGETDMNYLRHHMDRFINTYNRFDKTWDRSKGTRLLDIGAHWLHQSMVFKYGGYQVVAADLPMTFGVDDVRSLASQHDIELVGYEDLSAPDCLKAIPSDSIDVVLMSEIIEHITFNPMAMWKEIYRVMKPGSRIVVTTPNYYRTGGRAWRINKFLQGLGSGITVTEILTIHTTGHHWKEFSRRELQYYFHLLSSDFDCVKSDHVNDDMENISTLQKLVRPLRQNLHLEFDLTRKSQGIVGDVNWT